MAKVEILVGECVGPSSRAKAGLKSPETFLGKNHMEFMYTDLKYPYDYTGTGLAAFAYSLLDCSARSNINLSYFKPNFVVSSKLPAQLQNLPLLISQKIFENLTRIDQISLKDSTSFDFNPKKFSALPVSLDYQARILRFF